MKNWSSLSHHSSHNVFAQSSLRSNASISQNIAVAMLFSLVSCSLSLVIDYLHKSQHTLTLALSIILVRPSITNNVSLALLPLQIQQIEPLAALLRSLNQSMLLLFNWYCH